MSQRMDMHSTEAERPKSAGLRMTGSTHWHERFMAVLAGASESNLRQLNVLLRTGLGLVLLFELGSWLDVARFKPALLNTEQVFLIFDIALAGVGLCLTCFAWFKNNWRPVMMGFCLILITSRTFATIAIDQDEPLLLALLVLALGTAALVPWGARWTGLA
jgi:hypothetical protein